MEWMHLVEGTQSVPFYEVYQRDHVALHVPMDAHEVWLVHTCAGLQWINAQRTQVQTIHLKRCLQMHPEDREVCFLMHAFYFQRNFYIVQVLETPATSKFHTAEERHADFEKEWWVHYRPDVHDPTQIFWLWKTPIFNQRTDTVMRVFYISPSQPSLPSYFYAVMEQLPAFAILFWDGSKLFTCESPGAHFEHLASPFSPASFAPGFYRCVWSNGQWHMLEKSEKKCTTLRTHVFRIQTHHPPCTK